MTGRISKIGDAGVRAALYEAANIILTKPEGSALKSWAARLALRAGMRKAKVGNAVLFGDFDETISAHRRACAADQRWAAWACAAC